MNGVFSIMSHLKTRWPDVACSVVPNNLKKARTKLPKTIQKYIWPEKRNGPITITFVPIIN